MNYTKTNWENDITPVSAENMNKIEDQIMALTNALYPIGSIYISTISVNPSTYFGGSWVEFGKGKTLVGVDTADSNFNTVKKTGGESTHTLTTAEIPSHTHTTESNGAHTHGMDNCSASGSKAAQLESYAKGNSANRSCPTRSAGAHTHTITATGGSGAHNNLQPYITVYIWERTA